MKKWKITARDIAYIALFTALLAISAWITVPLVVPFTMQTFAMLLMAALLGARRSAICVLLYLVLGMIGIPVFSGFSGGVGVIAGPTGGYLIGFLPMVLIAAWLMKLLGQRFFAQCLAMACGVLVCYAFGTVWFMLVYMHGAEEIALGAVLMKCVVPFILPDIAKIVLAAFSARRLAKLVRV